MASDDATGIRLIIDPPMTGAQNMARDEALLDEARATLRLYGWAPACVSLGRTQTVADIDADAAAEAGVDIVPRKTGGGAILHGETEVTYAVILPHDHPGLPANILESYRFIAGPIVDALRALGADAHFEQGKGGRDTLCYLREEGVSIFVDDKKISGGAQRRTQKAVLQHGTIVVNRDAARTARILKAPLEAVERKVTGLDILGISSTREAIVAALVEAYENAWGSLSEVRLEA